MKQQEIRRNKGEKTKNLRKEETKNTTKTATFLWRFFWAFFHYKTGHFLRFLPIFCPPIEVTAIYIYIVNSKVRKMNSADSTPLADRLTNFVIYLRALQSIHLISSFC